MSFVLDHVILLCSPEAPEADELVRAGLTEGSRNTHPGQGTANRRFFFSNAYLEFLWLRDRAELESGPARRLGLLERWSGTHSNSCPFGFVLRPATSEVLEPPFRSWAYRPAYLPPEFAIHVAGDIPLTEPMVLQFGFFRGSNTLTAEPTQHQLATERITGISIATPAYGTLSESARIIERAGICSFEPAASSLMTITFDNAAQGACADFRPTYPLVLRW